MEAVDEFNSRSDAGSFSLLDPPSLPGLQNGNYDPDISGIMPIDVSPDENEQKSQNDNQDSLANSTEEADFIKRPHNSDKDSDDESVKPISSESDNEGSVKAVSSSESDNEGSVKAVSSSESDNEEPVKAASPCASDDRGDEEEKGNGTCITVSDDEMEAKRNAKQSDIDDNAEGTDLHHESNTDMDSEKDPTERNVENFVNCSDNTVDLSATKEMENESKLPEDEQENSSEQEQEKSTTGPQVTVSSPNDTSLFEEDEKSELTATKELIQEGTDETANPAADVSPGDVTLEVKFDEDRKEDLEKRDGQPNMSEEDKIQPCSEENNSAVFIDSTTATETETGDTEDDDTEKAEALSEVEIERVIKDITLSPEEEQYYSTFRENKMDKHECTVCKKVFIGRSKEKAYMHPNLIVLVCEKCRKFYANGSFAKDEEGYDNYCRWCANGGEMFCCSNCTNAFCKKCVKRHFPPKIFSSIDASDDWECFLCNTKPLWKFRAVCRSFFQTLASENIETRQKAEKTKGKTPHPSRKSARITDSDNKRTSRRNLPAKKGKKAKGASSADEVTSGCSERRVKRSSAAKNVKTEEESSDEFDNDGIRQYFDDATTVVEYLYRAVPKLKRKYKKIGENGEKIQTFVKKLRSMHQSIRDNVGILDELIVNWFVENGYGTAADVALENSIERSPTHDHDASETPNMENKNVVHSTPREPTSTSMQTTCNGASVCSDGDRESVVKETSNERAKRLLLHSSDDDERALLHKETSSKRRTKPGPLCSKRDKSLSPVKFVKVEDSLDLFSDNIADKARAASDSEDVFVSNENLKQCSVQLTLLSNDLLKKLENDGYVILPSKKHKNSVSLDDEIRRLCNIGTLGRRQSVKTVSRNGRSTKGKKKEEKSVSDVSSDSDSDAENSAVDNNSIKKGLNMSRNEAARVSLLMSDDDTSDSANDSEIKVEQSNLKKRTDKTRGPGSDGNGDKDATKKAYTHRLLRVQINDSDSDSDDNKPVKRTAKKTSSDSDAITPKSKQRRAVRSSTGTEEMDTDSDFIKPRKGKKRQAISDSDTDNTNKRSRKRTDNSSELPDSSSDENKKQPKKRKRIKNYSDNDSDSDVEIVENSQTSTPSKGRKNIRKVISHTDLNKMTKNAAREEEERRKRIAERQKLYNQSFDLSSATKQKVEEVVLDFDEKTRKAKLSVVPDLARKLKPHQANGIKFMWDAVYESIDRAQSESGSGCILAHCMGLGKTLQVIALVHTVLTDGNLNTKTVLVVSPKNTVLNWVSEFKKWLDDLNHDIIVWDLTKRNTNPKRAEYLKYWQRRGGVMVIGYEMYRNLTRSKPPAKGKKLLPIFQETLVDPGPDLCICDEGHSLKNNNSGLSKAMMQIKTRRRIVLTGTPLQNNLREYHCMVQFVKPSLLGTMQEFRNRFVNPISNGQCADSTAQDVKIMKRRAHVLHKLLEGCVQRLDYNILTPYLPTKFEYVLNIRITPKQIELYQYYLEHCAKGGHGAGLLADYQTLKRVWTHPFVLQLAKERSEENEETDDEAGSLKDFIDDRTSDSDSSDSNSEGSVYKPPKSTGADKDDNAQTEETENTVKKHWWVDMITEDEYYDIEQSGKLVLLFEILHECEQIGDKLLVFSPNLYSLDLIEEFLKRSENPSQSQDGHIGCWNIGSDYFRLDGSTSADNRMKWCNMFNRENNSRSRLFLISTKAGGLGINLYGANRVVIFDASWNPSHDLQSIFRVYRFGQRKPCYIYRFLSQGTMEEKIYVRQITKLSLSGRVIDEQQIERHFTMSDISELYQLTPDQREDQGPLAFPKDRLLCELLTKHRKWIVSYHEHDSLLQNVEEEELNEEERELAWEDYRREKQILADKENMRQAQNKAQQEMNDLILDIRQQFPQLTELEVAQRAQFIFTQRTATGTQLANIPNPHVQYLSTQVLQQYTAQPSVGPSQYTVQRSAGPSQYTVQPSAGPTRYSSQPVQKQYGVAKSTNSAIRVIQPRSLEVVDLTDQDPLSSVPTGNSDLRDPLELRSEHDSRPMTWYKPPET